MQQLEANTIQPADAGEAFEFPEGYVEGSSQLLLSATFLTTELALLQKSLDVNVHETKVSCPGMTVPAWWVCSENYLGAVGCTKAGDAGTDLGFYHQFAPAPTSLCPCHRHLLTHPSNCHCNQVFIHQPTTLTHWPSIHLLLSSHQPLIHPSCYHVFMP